MRRWLGNSFVTMPDSQPHEPREVGSGRNSIEAPTEREVTNGGNEDEDGKKIERTDGVGVDCAM